MEPTKSIYRGQVFHVEAMVFGNGSIPAEEWLDLQSWEQQQKFAALFKMLADAGKLWNEHKFKHLEGSNQIFEFKVDGGRILCFFFVGRRVILTHGFTKKSRKTPRGELERAERYKAEFIERVKV
jgi:phage-related protein